jgi:hypothetical protein
LKLEFTLKIPMEGSFLKVVKYQFFESRYKFQAN